MGADLIIIVFAVVVIGGMGSILGSIVTGFGLGLAEGLTKVFYPAGLVDRDLRHHDRRAAGQADRPVRAGRMTAASAGAPPAPSRRRAVRRRHRACAASRDLRGCSSWSRSRRRLSRLPDEGDVLRALRLGLQPAARLRRPAVLRPRRLFRHRQLCLRLRGEGLGLDAGARDPGRHGGGGRCSASVFGAVAIRRQGIYFAMITLALAQLVYFVVAAGAVHRRRGRHPGRAARASSSACSTSPTTVRSTPSWRVIFLAALAAHLPHRPFALRPGAARDPRERDRAPCRSATGSTATGSPSSSVGALSGLAGATKALVFQLASLTDVHWTMSGEVVLMTLIGGMGTLFGPIVGALVFVAHGILPGLDRLLGHGHRGRRLRRLRAGLPRGHRRRLGGPAQAASLTGWRSTSRPTCTQLRPRCLAP